MRRLVLLTLSLVALLPVASHAQQFKLASVRVEGSQRYDSDPVAAVSGLKVGDTVSIQDLQQAANRLAQVGVFEQVTFRYETAADDLSVVFRVEDSHRLRPCQFDNFIWFSREEILDRLKQEVPLFQGEAPAQGRLVQQIIVALNKLLAERGVQGYVAHEMNVGRMGASAENAANLFTVKGVTVSIAAVRFRQAEKLEAKKLEEASRRLEGIIYSSPFVQLFVEKTLLPLYHSEGFLRAAFSPPEVNALSPANGSFPVEVVLTVREGDSYRVREFHWEGTERLTPAELEKHLAVKRGGVANTVRLAEDLEKIREEEYGRVGHIQARLGFEPQLDDEQRTADIFIRVEEGDRFLFRELLIEGLPAKAAEEIRKRWKLEPGDTFNNVYFKFFRRNELNAALRRARVHPETVTHLIQTHPEDKTVSITLQFQ